MDETEPVAELSAFSDEGAVPTTWEHGRSELHSAQVYWLSTVRPSGHPHVTPLLAVWLTGAMYFCTGPSERKAHNLTRNPHCVLTTGRNTFGDVVDLVVEGEAALVGDESELRRVADAFESKYGAQFTAPEGAWFGLGDSIRAGDVALYRLAPKKAFGFGRGKHFSQTRWRFPGATGSH